VGYGGCGFTLSAHTSSTPNLTFDLGIAPDGPARDVVALARDAESLGLGGLWVADSQSLFREAFTVLGAAAACTRSLVLGTGVANVATRHPAVVAGAAATLAELSGGRFVLGLGAGASSVRTVGLKPVRLAQLEEAIRVVRALVRGESAVWEGHELRTPWAGTDVPIYLAAAGPRALELAGRVADGVIVQAGVHPQLVQQALGAVEASAVAAGRSPADVVVCARVGCSVDRDRERARDAMRSYAADAAKTVFDSVPRDRIPADLLDDLERLDAGYDWHGRGSGGAHDALVSDRVLDAFAIAGTPEEVARRFRRIAALGVRRIIVRGASVRDAASFARTLADEVFPLLA
jgi:5,10-methylenetetrahydromethanopterin reductase